MTFVAAKCPTCSAGIQVPDDTETTFCAYCGNRIQVQSAIQQYRIEISGQIQVNGISTAEQRFKQAENLLALKAWDKAVEAFDKLISTVPEDFRGWWGWVIAVVNYYMDIMEKSSQRGDGCHVRLDEAEMIEHRLSSAFSLMSESQKKEYSMKNDALWTGFVDTYVHFLSSIRKDPMYYFRTLSDPAKFSCYQKIHPKLYWLASSRCVYCGYDKHTAFTKECKQCGKPWYR